MCGISAMCSKKEALPFILQGLKKLEYRGYDSAGISVIDNGHITMVKTKGKLSDLEAKLQNYTITATVGIGHTRWATHGVPSDVNSHPHTNTAGTLSIVHNGIIENYAKLKEELIAKGYDFKSQTDSEVIVALLDEYYNGNLLETMHKVLKLLEGSYAIFAISATEPDQIVVAKKDSPVVIGQNEDSVFGASDIPALLEYTKDIYFLQDGEMAVLKSDSVKFYDSNLNEIEKEKTVVPYDTEAAKKDGYDTYMLKEIYEQPNVIKETLRGRIADQIIFDELKDVDFSKFNKVYFVACGTAYHASLVGASILEKLTHLPVITQVASEFRYNEPLVDEHSLCIFVSQSGETADTLAGLRLAKSLNATTIAVANVVGSSISREADYTLYTWAGPEIAVASTKAYTTQVILLILFAIYMSECLNIEIENKAELLSQITSLPEKIVHLLEDHEKFEHYASYLSDQKDAYFIGRGLDYVSVLEGALKLKEISYVHADAYLAGELKHGPIALIEEGTVVFAVALQAHINAKTISNIQETIARGAKVILFTLENTPVTGVQEVYTIENVHPILQPILVAIPLQMIAYYTAKIKGCNVDQPRNLAKSVTVE